VEGVGCLNRLHVHIGALGRAALVRVAGVEGAGVVGSNGGCQLIEQGLDVLLVNQLNLPKGAGQKEEGQQQ